MTDYEKYIPDTDIYLFNTGEAQTAYDLFGCHYVKKAACWRFCLWAPNARSVSVVGDFNDWNEEAGRMDFYKNGVWVSFVKNIEEGDNYKYMVLGYDGSRVLKADPFAFYSELRPNSASRVWRLDGYEWHDRKFLSNRAKTNVRESPVSIYELHLGSWKNESESLFPNYRSIADELAEYLHSMRFTHVQLMPLMEYPLDDSRGYQVTGFYSVTSRYGSPQDFMYFVDKLHSKGIGVIMEWTPEYFPRDEHGLARFDGTWLYEHENAAIRENSVGTYIFNFSKPEVQSFLVSSAVFWMEKYHLDGLMMGLISSILYYDYDRGGYYLTNTEEGNIDLSAVEFLKKVNSVVKTRCAGALTACEELTSYPMVTKSPGEDGLGFTFKWDAGFSHDSLSYLNMDHYFRQFEHSKMLFSLYYAFDESYILAFSHNEVSHGKASMIDKMYGDYWQKFASLRALYGFMYAHPGKKLLFMGDEFAQFVEWDYSKQLDWFLLEYTSHSGMRKFIKRLNGIYAKMPVLFAADDSAESFEWLRAEDNELSAYAFMRTGNGNPLICLCNFTPLVREKYTVKLPGQGALKLLLNSDNSVFGGAGTSAVRNSEAIKSTTSGEAYTAEVRLPPLTVLYYEFVPAKVLKEEVK